MEMRPDTYTNDSGTTNLPTPRSRMEFYSTENGGNIVRYDSRSPIHPGYTHVIGGGFGSGQGADIFCYDPVLGQGDVWHRTDSGGLVWLSTTSLRKGCTLVIAANQAGNDNRDIVLYNPTESTIDVHQVDDPGKLTLLKTTTGVRQTWTAAAAGDYGDRPYHNLFFYDAAAGLGEFYAADGQGGLTKVGEQSDLRKGCNLVINGNFGNTPRSDIMLNDPSVPEGVFYGVDHFTMRQLYTINNWRSSFTYITGGKWSDSPYSDIAQYDPTKGELLMRSLDGKGGITTLKTHSVPKDWTASGGAGSFRGGPTTPTMDHMVFYNRTVGVDVPVVTTPPTDPDPTQTPAPDIKMTGKLGLFTMDDWGMLGTVKTVTGLRAWTHMLLGNFSDSMPIRTIQPDTDLFFYDSATGDAETVEVGEDGTLTTIATFTGLMTGAMPILFEYDSFKTGIILYHPDKDIEVYNVISTKMTLLKTYPTWGQKWDIVIRGKFEGDFSTITNDFIFYRKDTGYWENWSMDMQGNNLRRAYAYDSHGQNLYTQMIPGKFYGHPYMDYLTYNYDTGQVMFFRGGEKDVYWASLVAVASEPQATWDLMIPVTLGHRKPRRGGVLAYSFDKQRAETKDIQPDGGGLTTVKHLDNIGRWKMAASMSTIDTTKRVVFFSPTGD